MTSTETSSFSEAPAPAPEEPAPAPAPDPAPAPAPAAPQASPEDQAAIEKLLTDWTQQPTFADYARYANDNMCHRVAEANGGLAFVDPAIVPDVTFSEEERASMGLQKIEGLTVNGDTASALVTSGTGPGTRTVTMYFQREDGRWKMCNAPG